MSDNSFLHDALDGFGAKHSNIDRVWHLRPDIVTLDRCILQQASEHSHISRSSEHEDCCHKEGHAGRGVWVCGSGIADAMDGQGEDGGCSADADEKCAPLKSACI